MEKPGVAKLERKIIFPGTLKEMMLKEELTKTLEIYQDLFRRYHLIKIKEGEVFPRNEFVEGFDFYGFEPENRFVLEFTIFKKTESESRSRISDRRYFCLRNELWIISPSGKYEFNFVKSYYESETLFSIFEEKRAKQFLFNHQRGVSFYKIN